MRPLLLPALVGCLSCSTPVEAPVAFDGLCAFVFEHASDEDPEALAQGVVNLQSWLERNRDSVEEGYVVNNMDPAWVEAHEGKPYDLTDLLGVALALEQGYLAPDEVLLVDAEIELVCVDREKKLVRLPSTVRSVMGP